MDSFDGAEHCSSGRRRTSIVSFSSQIFSTKTVEEGASTSESFNILIWQQMICSENSENIFPVIDSIYEHKRQMMNKRDQYLII